MTRPHAAIRSRLALVALLAVATSVAAAAKLKGSEAPDFVLELAARTRGCRSFAARS